ncbi:DUF1772 domain-containing protein [Pseudonocardia ailaonensis]
MLVLGIVTVVVVGLLVGVEFAVAAFVNPIFAGLPGDGGLRGRTAGAQLLGRVMPFWYIGSLLLAAGWAALAWGGAAAPLVILAAALLVVSVLMSVTLLVPINDRVRTWAAGEPPADWKEQVRRWDRLHHLRVSVIVAAFVLLAVAGAR